MFKANLAVRYDGGDRVIAGYRGEDHHHVKQGSFVLYTLYWPARYDPPSKGV